MQTAEAVMTTQEVANRLSQLFKENKWMEAQEELFSDDAKSIERAFTLKNFVECVDLINKITGIAEDQMHHPDLHLTGYKNLKVVLYTHALGGVTENDLIVAAKINQSGR